MTDRSSSSTNKPPALPKARHPPGAIATFLGVHRDTVSGWWQAYQTEGEVALKQQRRGRQVGEQRRLSVEQCEALQDDMTTHYLADFGIDSALWTRRALQTLIQQQYQIIVPLLASVPTGGEICSPKFVPLSIRECGKVFLLFRPSKRRLTPRNLYSLWVE